MKLSIIALTSLLCTTFAFANSNMTYIDTYARATPPKAENSAIFMTIENPTETARTILSAESDTANKVELHILEKQGDIMKMRQVDSFEIPAKGQKKLFPGGPHIMLLGLNQALKEGEHVEVKLVYKNGDQDTLTVPVKKIMGTMNHSEMNHHRSNH